MYYKIERAIEANRNKFIVFGILWLIIIIVGVAPFSVALTNATQGANLDSEIFIEQFGIYLVKPFTSLGVAFSKMYISDFGKSILTFSIIYFIAMLIGLIKSSPKNEYTDIEHGSSGWAEHGEQYKILSKKSGIILGENNYLPLNKMGNINVLVVGRIRFW